jgi:hypothetical protein
MENSKWLSLRRIYRMSKVCLGIIFNHKFNKNIPVLEKIYRSRFCDLYYIVPFNTESIQGINPDRIIPVYETSYCFQGYITQAYESLKNEKYSHYIFIGDDQILNPKLNENNILTELGILENESYIKEIFPYHEIANGSLKDQSNKLYNILSAFRINGGVSYEAEIPSYEAACEKCRHHGLKIAKRLPLKFFLTRGYLHPKYLPLTLVTLGINRGFRLPYPLFKAYSDLIIIDKNSMEEFCRLSGVFAAMNIFVETAIPLAMVLACSTIRTEKKLMNHYHGVENWDEEIPRFEEKYRKDLDVLFDNWDESVLYYHPIKLSKWKIGE